MHAWLYFYMQNPYGIFPVECGTVVLVMWVDGGKHKAGLYLQAWAAWLTQPNQLHNLHGVNSFLHSEVPTLANLTRCSTPALFLSPLTPVLHSHIQEILDFLPNDGLQFYPAPRDAGEIRPILLLTGVFLCLESGQWLGNEGHSETGQREKVSDSFPWHWENSTDECALFSLIIQHKRENPTIEPPRASSPSDGLCLREDALTGTDVITNDL